ncbi:MAG: DinB family protein [Gemmatimonadaceae bacterium]
MHPRIQQAVTHLDVTRASLEQAVNDVPENSRERRPSDDRWSVAQVVQHLAMVEGRIAALLRAKWEEARAVGLGKDQATSPITPSFDVDGLKNRSAALVAREGSIPEPSVTSVEALKALSASRATLRAFIDDADGDDLSAVMAPHGRFGLMSVYDWLMFIGGHEARHTEQVREVGQQVA